MADDDAAADAAADVDEGFSNYEEQTLDPGIWLLLGTCLFCFGVMLFVVPMLVYFKNKWRQKAKREGKIDQTVPIIDDGKVRPKVDANFRNIFRPDTETYKILKLAVPYSISALASSVLSNASLIMVSQKLGVKSLAAYALATLLVALPDGIVKGPIYACTTLCAQSVGAGNNLRAGNYIQLSVLMYLMLSVPLVAFWWTNMRKIILFLEWGDESTADLAQRFTRPYLFSVLLEGVSASVWELLEVTDHAVEGTIASIAWGVVNVIGVSLVVFLSEDPQIEHVAYVFVASAFLFVFGTLAFATWRKWLQPFREGLYMTFSLRAPKTMNNLLKQAVPLSFGSLLSNAEWTILTFFASHLGPAEVATWAILGSIWDVFYSTTAGIGDAAEIRVAFHLGDGHPTMARLSAYKSLMLGMMVASVISIVYFSLQNRVPEWFTDDETLQKMLRELIPFVGVGNLTMTFGMQCWSLIGAQGKYKLATWISFVSSWGVTMPMAAIYVYIFYIDLQGLTSAVVIGYVVTGACLSYVLLSTDWYGVARKIRSDNEETLAGEEVSTDQELYAALHHGRASQAVARRNVRLVTIPAGTRSGLMIGNIFGRKGTYVLLVRNWSPLIGRIKAGDSILAIDGTNVREEGAGKIAGRMVERQWYDRDLSVIAPPADLDIENEDDDHVMIEELAEDDPEDEASRTGKNNNDNNNNGGGGGGGEWQDKTHTAVHYDLMEDSRFGDRSSVATVGQSSVNTANDPSLTDASFTTAANTYEASSTTGGATASHASDSAAAVGSVSTAERSSYIRMQDLRAREIIDVTHLQAVPPPGSSNPQPSESADPAPSPSGPRRKIHGTVLGNKN